MKELNTDQRQALLRKIIDNFSDYQYSEEQDGCIVLSDSESQLRIFPQEENYYAISFEFGGAYFEENNSLWRHLDETVKSLKFNLDEKNKFEKSIEDENNLQEKLDQYLGL